MTLSITLLPAFSDNFIFFLRDHTTGTTAVVDPGDADVVLTHLKSEGLTLDLILNTHHHSDHIGGNTRLKQETNAKLIAPQYETGRIVGADRYVRDGDSVQIGATKCEVWFTPGHTRGHICYVDRDDAKLFCGDTLFSLGCGRLFEGTAEQMWANMLRFRTLAPNTAIYFAHEYTLSNAHFALSIDAENQALIARADGIQKLRAAGLPSVPCLLSDEIATNPFLRCDENTFKHKLGLSDKSPEDVFAYIRKLKDAF